MYATERELADLRRSNRAVAWLAFAIVVLAVLALAIADPDGAERFLRGLALPVREDAASDPNAAALPSGGAVSTPTDNA